MGQVIGAAGGIGDFVNAIRARFGRAGEFVNMHGFDYGQVYNSLLQYAVMNAYQERQNHDLLATFRDESNEMGSKSLIVGCVFLSILTIAVLANFITNITAACRQRN